jgi:hypothetical protein
MPSVMPHNQDPDRLSDDAEQKVKRKAFQVRPADVALSDGKALWVLGSSHHKLSHFGVEFIGELPRGHLLIPLHDLVDV